MTMSNGVNLSDEMIEQSEYEDGCLYPVTYHEEDAILMQQILDEKRGEPNKYASYWEMDENDVDEPTEEEIQNSPTLRILWAGENGKVDVLEEILATDSQLLHCIDTDGYSPLHRASYNGHAQAIEYLLEQGSDVNALTNDHWTPLHSAAAWGQHESACVLLSHGAQINAQTLGGQTPLHLIARAEEVSRPMLEMFLMNRNLDPSLKNHVGETARDLALRSSPYHWMFECCEDGVNKLC